MFRILLVVHIIVCTAMGYGNSKGSNGNNSGKTMGGNTMCGKSMTFEFKGKNKGGWGKGRWQLYEWGWGPRMILRTERLPDSTGKGMHDNKGGDIMGKCNNTSDDMVGNHNGDNNDEYDNQSNTMTNDDTEFFTMGGRVTIDDVRLACGPNA